MQNENRDFFKTSAYFISPDGQVLPVVNHIATVIQEPERFGLDLAHIRSLYESYNETLGTEGKARREILLELVHKGWVRIRLHRNSHWSINVHELDTGTQDRLCAWTAAYLNENEAAPNFDPYLKVRIEVFRDGNCRECMFEELVHIQFFQKTPILQCRCNDIDIMGHFIVLKPYDYIIKIDSPFSGFVIASPHVAYFARGSFKPNITGAGTIPEHCISHAKKTLQELYQSLVFFEQNCETIKKHYAEIKKTLEAYDQYNDSITNGEFLKMRIKLRRERKAGLVDIVQYQKQLEALNKKKDKIWRMKFETISQLRYCIVKEFGVSLAHDFIEQLVEKNLIE